MEHLIVQASCIIRGYPSSLVVLRSGVRLSLFADGEEININLNLNIKIKIRIRITDKG